MNPSSFTVTANRHVTIGSGASLLPPPSPPPPSPPVTVEEIYSLLQKLEESSTVTAPPSPPSSIRLLEETMLKMEQAQREWDEYMDRKYPPPIQPSPSLLVSHPPSPSPDLPPPPSADPDLLVVVHPTSAAKPDLPHPPLPPSLVIQESPPLRICCSTGSTAGNEDLLPPPSPLLDLSFPPLPSPLKPPLLSAVAVVAVHQGEERTAAAQTLAAWAWVQVEGRKWAHQMGLEAEAHQLKPEPEFSIILYPMEMRVWAQEMKIKPTFYKMQVLLKDRVGIG